MLQLDGAHTLSENIADNGGMKMAYLAFKSWQKKARATDSFRLPGIDFTPDQLFFLGMSQVGISLFSLFSFVLPF